MTKNRIIRNRRGQIVIEYVLILVLVVTCASILVQKLVSRREEGGAPKGVIIKSWDRMIRAIASDVPDCPHQKDFSKPNCPTN